MLMRRVVVAVLLCELVLCEGRLIKGQAVLAERSLGTKAETLRHEAGFSSAVAGAACCTDDSSYVDPNYGGGCDGWVGFDCKIAKNAAALLKACPVACKAVPPGDGQACYAFCKEMVFYPWAERCEWYSALCSACEPCKNRKVANALSLGHIFARLETLPGKQTYQTCEGTYVRNWAQIQGRDVWDRVSPDPSRFIFYCGGKWRITHSQWRAEMIKEGGGGCGHFLSSDNDAGEWYDASWAQAGASASPTTSAYLEALPSKDIYQECEGGYVRSNDKIQGRDVWDRVSKHGFSDLGRFIFYCGGKWRITHSQWRADLIEQGGGNCSHFLSSDTSAGEWYDASWPPNGTTWAPKPVPAKLYDAIYRGWPGVIDDRESVFVAGSKHVPEYAFRLLQPTSGNFTLPTSYEIVSRADADFNAVAAQIIPILAPAVYRCILRADPQMKSYARDECDCEWVMSRLICSPGPGCCGPRTALGSGLFLEGGGDTSSSWEKPENLRFLTVGSLPRFSSGSGAASKTGECTLDLHPNRDGKTCARSPNYPSAYGNNHYCVISGVPIDKTLTFTSFDVEHSAACIYDSLTISGTEYCGQSAPQGIKASDGKLTWSSDGSVTKQGWELCWAPPPPPLPRRQFSTFWPPKPDVLWAASMASTPHDPGPNPGLCGDPRSDPTFLRTGPLGEPGTLHDADSRFLLDLGGGWYRMASETLYDSSRLLIRHKFTAAEQQEFRPADCWEACGRKGGPCPSFCGEGMACCKNGAPDPECPANMRQYSFHTCTEATSIT